LPTPEARFSGLARKAQAEGRLPSLSAAVFQKGRLVWSEAIGLADVEAGREATPDTQYLIASITKTFVAASVLQLRDAGALDLDDPVSRHVPEAAHDTLTLRRLLAHISGLQRETPGEIWETLEFPAREELLARLAEAETVLEPGERWHYSNLGYILLGEIVARIAGTELSEYIEDRLIRPLGLSRTGWEPQEPVARPYFVQPYSEAVHGEPVIDQSGTAGAGGLWSTTEDLARWGGFLVDPDPAVLSPASAEAMRSVQTMVAPDWSRGWGLGLELFRRGERIFVGHTGGMPGFVSVLAVSPVEKIGAVALASSTIWPNLVDFGLELAVAAVEDLSGPEPWRPEAAPPDELAALAGRWWSEGSEFVFAVRNGKLEARSASGKGEPSVFEPEGADRFRTASGGERGEPLRVVRNESGAPVKLYWATYPFLRTPELFGASAAQRSPASKNQTTKPT
jgi:CubicO group peptidase (beta-lactamase class C family)